MKKIDFKKGNLFLKIIAFISFIAFVFAICLYFKPVVSQDVSATFILALVACLTYTLIVAWLCIKRLDLVINGFKYLESHVADIEKENASIYPDQFVKVLKEINISNSALAVAVRYICSTVPRQQLEELIEYLYYERTHRDFEEIIRNNFNKRFPSWSIEDLLETYGKKNKKFYKDLQFNKIVTRSIALVYPSVAAPVIARYIIAADRDSSPVHIVEKINENIRSHFYQKGYDAIIAKEFSHQLTLETLRLMSK